MFKTLNRNENFTSMNENDLMMYMIDKLSEEINLKNKSASNSNVVTPAGSPQFPEFVECKLEKESVDDKSENTELNTPLQINNNLMLGMESFNKRNSQHKQTGQFKCPCGDSFEALPLFLQHNFKCLNSKPQVKVELTTSRKRNSNIITSDCFEEPTKKSAGYNCVNCNRKFRTSSTLYQHECQNKITNKCPPENIVAIKTPIEMPSVVELNNSLKTEVDDKITSISKSVPIFTCHCLKEFTDYTEFFKHSNQCGKPSEKDTSFSSCSSKSSPLKVLPNSEGKYECKDCPKSFTSILSLRQHRDGMHRHAPKYVCKLCGKAYRWCTSFHYHKKQCTENC